MRKEYRLTLEDVEQIRSEFITPDVAARVIGCNPTYIRVLAHQHPEQLGFPVFIVGSRVKIPRRQFIRWILGQPEPEAEAVEDAE